MKHAGKLGALLIAALLGTSATAALAASSPEHQMLQNLRAKEMAAKEARKQMDEMNQSDAHVSRETLQNLRAKMIAGEEARKQMAEIDQEARNLQRAYEERKAARRADPAHIEALKRCGSACRPPKR